jgi:hypothetical protein
MDNQAKKAFQQRKHTEDTETQCLPGATIHPLAGDDGAGVKLMVWSGFFRVIPWQMRFIGSTAVVDLNSGMCDFFMLSELFAYTLGR